MAKNCLIVLILTSLTACRFFKFPNISAEPQFESWLTTYNKEIISAAEYTYRLQIFSENLQKIERHNASNSSYEVGLNDFAHLTFKEFAHKYLDMNLQSSLDPLSQESNPVPFGFPKVKSRKMNWNDQGKVTPVQNQGGCGSCYAFASVSALESYHAIYVNPSNPPPVLSKQFMVDCGRVKGYGLGGCDGGNPQGAFNFLKNEGTVLDYLYPYKEANGRCQSGFDIFTKLKDFRKLEAGANNIIEALEKGPVMISYEFNDSLVFYRKGIYQTFALCGFNKNHAMLAVGYDLDAEIPHFIVKNSHGANWGIKGFLKIAIGKLNSKGMCWLASGDSYAPVYS